MTVMPGKGIFAKLQAFWEVMKRGREVFDPVKWKLRQITAVHIGTFISALILFSRTFGYDFDLSQEQINGLASTVMLIASVFNHFITVATTPEINVLGGKDRRSSEREDDDSIVVTTGKRQQPLQQVDNPSSGSGTKNYPDISGVNDIDATQTKLPNQREPEQQRSRIAQAMDEFEQQRNRDSQGG